MDTHLNVLLITLLSLFPATLSACPTSSCANSSPPIRFPFQLLPQQHQNSIYPGFSLSCNAQAFTILTLPNSGDFYVDHIDYYQQQITLSDPQKCMADRLMHLNLSDSPFSVDYYRNYTIISCPTHLIPSRYATIHCLSNSTTSVLATTSLALAKSVSKSCTIVSTLPIPISFSPHLPPQTGFSSDFVQDYFRLSWNITACISCEAAGGFCSLTNSGLGCYPDCQSQSGLPQSDIRVFRIVLLILTIPAVSFTFFMAIYLWFLAQRRSHRDWIQSRAAIAPLPPSSTISSLNGLDALTIDSYAKMVVGESKRIPGPNDTACPICLADYCPKDTLRSIPECRHCFHADCVDEWLRSNPTCPVCRNSPSIQPSEF